MPKQTASSGFAKMYGDKLNKAVKKVANNPTDYGRIQLPPGINAGVAQLKKCGFAKYKTGANAGQYYFRAEGVVIEPKEVIHNGQRITVEGQMTSIMIPCCDTKNSQGKVTSQEEHIDTVLNELRKLGADTTDVGAEDLEPMAEALVEAAPYFRFSTSQSAPTPQYPDPKIWENWNGTRGLEDYTPEDVPAVEEEEGAEAGTEEEEEPEATETTEESIESADETDLDALAELANGGDEDAGSKLTDLAVEAGISAKWVSDKAESWAEVAEKIKEKTAPAEEAEPEAESEAETEEEWAPEVGEIYLYKIIDPKTKKPVVDPKTKKERKGVEHEIKAVDKKSKTVTLLNMDDKKTTVKGVKWDLLEGS